MFTTEDFIEAAETCIIGAGELSYQEMGAILADVANKKLQLWEATSRVHSFSEAKRLITMLRCRIDDLKKELGKE